MDLFPDNPKFKATHWVDIDRDPALWDSYITNEVKKVVGDRDVSITVIWHNRDDTKGTGVGSAAVVGNTSKHRFVVPIVLKDFKIAPLDSMFTETSALRFTEDNVDDVLFTGNLGAGIAKRKGPGNNRIQWEVTKYSSVNWLYWAHALQNGYEVPERELVIEKVAGTVARGDLERVRSQMAVPSVLYKYSGAMKAKLVDIVDSDVLLGKKEYDDNVKDRVETIAKVGPDTYVVASNSIDNFAPSLDLMQGRDVKVTLARTLGEEDVVNQILDAVENEGESGVVVPWPKQDGPIVAFGPDKRELVGGEDGFFTFLKPNEGLIDGFRFNTLYNLDNKKQSGCVIVTDEGGGIHSDTIKGFKAPSYNMPLDAPRAGETGIIMYLIEDDDSSRGVVAYGPFEVMAVGGSDMPIAKGDDVEWEDNRYTLRDRNNKIHQVSFDSYIRGVTKVNDIWDSGQRKDVQGYRLPKDANWVVIKSAQKYTTPMRETGTQKEAHLRFDGTHFHLDNIEGLGKWASLLDEFKCKTVLSILGTGFHKAASLIDGARRHGDIRVRGLRMPEAQKEAAAPDFFSVKEKYDLTKIASTFDDMATVDAILSLGFMNKSNINKFVSIAPRLRDTMEDLIRLLMVSRIGAPEIEEDAVMQAIDAIDETIKGLDTLRLRQESLGL
jgi:hypothetical protein